MTKNNLHHLWSYDPDRLLDKVSDRLNAKNDAALSRALEVAPPIISKIRHRHLQVSPFMLIRMHEMTNFSIKELRYLMGDERPIYKCS